jgi:hypothetical protein
MQGLLLLGKLLPNQGGNRICLEWNRSRLLREPQFDRPRAPLLVTMSTCWPSGFSSAMCSRSAAALSESSGWLRDGRPGEW